jgi:hypothetical protein
MGQAKKTRKPGLGWAVGVVREGGIRPELSLLLLFSLNLIRKRKHSRADLGWRQCKKRRGG